MKTMTLLTFAAILFSMPVHAKDPMPVKDVVININDAFIPGGITVNSEAYAVVSGLFPNGCYRWKQADVKNLTDFEHEVTVMASVSQGMCIQVLVPYSKEIKFGKLLSGKHFLRFMSGDGTYLEKILEVE